MEVAIPPGERGGREGERGRGGERGREGEGGGGTEGVSESSEK